MNYNKYKTVHNKKPITTDLIEEHFTQQKDEFVKTLTELYYRHNKADNRHFGEMIYNIYSPVGTTCERDVWIYVNLIYTYVRIFGSYILNYYEEYAFGFFSFFFVILLEKNSALMNLYIKNNKEILSAISYDKGRDTIIETWQNAIKELKDNFKQYSLSQFLKMIKKNPLSAFFTDNEWLIEILSGLQKTFLSILKVLYNSFKKFAKKIRTLPADQLYNEEDLDNALDFSRIYRWRAIRRKLV